MTGGHLLKQRLKNGVYRGVGAAGRLRRAATGWAGLDDEEAPLRILVYHKVSPRDPNPPNVPPGLFRQHMERLRAHCTPISLDDYLAARAGVRALPPRPAMVTFDDGYRDNLTEAAPILRALGIPAVIFLPTGFLGTGRALPHDEHLRADGIDNPVLTWEEARALPDLGVEVGSHGESHRMFSRLPLVEARREILGSRRLLEERLGRPVRAFAYVKGGRDSYTPEVVRAVEEAGYQVAFTGITGPASPRDPRFEVPRYNVEPLPAATFERLLLGDCDLMAWKDSQAGIAAKRWLNRALGSEVP